MSFKLRVTLFFVAFSFCDLMVTLVGLSRGLAEANFFFHNLTLFEFVLLKVGATAMVALAAATLSQKRFLRMMGVAIFLYAFAVVINISQIVGA